MTFVGPNKKGMGGGAAHVYLSIPEDMQDCLYDLEFKALKYVPEKMFFVAEFKVLATDTPIKAGKIASKVFDPTQEHADTYFWRDLYDLRTALRGKQPNARIREKLAAKQADTSVDGVLALLSGCEGRECRLVYERYTNKQGKDKYATTWQPTDAEAES